MEDCLFSIRLYVESFISFKLIIIIIIINLKLVNDVMHKSENYITGYLKNQKSRQF